MVGVTDADATAADRWVLCDGTSELLDLGEAIEASGAATHGVIGWGDGSASFDIGNEVCAAMNQTGLTCQTTHELDGTNQNCTYDHNGAYFYAHCY